MVSVIGPLSTGVLLLGLLGSAALARRSLAVVRVRGTSMLPTLADNDRVLAITALRLRRPGLGDIVVIRGPGRTPDGARELWIKRVVALPGQSTDQYCLGDIRPWGRVPAGSVFVVGDGPRSRDSRATGPIAMTHLHGVVVRRIGSRAELRQPENPWSV